MFSQRLIRNPISRRTFLRGAGVCLSLPMLEAMRRPFAHGASLAGTELPKRQVFLNGGLGFHGPYFFPKGTGKNYEMSAYLKPLEDLRNEMTIFSGLSHPEQNGVNGHASGLTWLTSAPRPGLAGFKNSISLDQLIASEIGPQTRFPYLTLSNAGESLSWTANGVAIPAESSPSKVFKTLFIDGTPSEIETQVRDLKNGRSILDTVGTRAKRLEKQLGPQDADKLDQYFTSLRELEQRLLQNEAWAKKPKPKVGAKPPTDIQNRNDAIGRQKLMYDLIALALETDSTRSVCFNLGGLNSVPVVEGVNSDWHNLSHHGQDEDKIEELKLIEQAEINAFADFVKKLKSVKEGTGTLLDRTCVMFGSNLGNASSHDWHNLPILLAGGGFRHGQHLAFDPKNNVRLSNLFVMLAQRMGVETDRFGSSDRAGIQGFELA